MKLSLANLETSDFSAGADIIADAITDPGQGNPGGEWISATWPRLNEPEGRAKTVERLAGVHAALRPGSIIKVVDEDAGGKAVGLAVWNVYDTIPDALPGLDLGDDFWLSADERAYAEHVQDATNAEWLQHYKAVGAPLIALEVFVIHPTYKRRGAGKLLLADGIAKATAMNAAIFVNATAPGEKLYRNYDFHFTDGGRTKLPQGKWTNKPHSGLGCMVRPRPSALK